MESDRRIHARRVLEIRPAGFLSILIDGQEVSALAIEDVSPFGIGVLVDADIQPGAMVVLRYVHADIDLSVSGAVVWAAASGDSAGSRLGIYMREQDMSANVAFFNAITA